MAKIAIILSGGLGTRLKPFTDIIPKPLLPVGEKAILERQIESLKGYGFDEIYLATNYKSEYIKNFFGDGKKYGVNLHISNEDIPLGTAGPVKLLEKEILSPVLVMNGDILTNMDFEKFYRFGCESDSVMSVAIKKILMPYQFGNIEFVGDYVKNIIEKPNIETYALAGIYVMKKEVLDYIPPSTYFGMDKLILKLLDENKMITKYEMTDDYWLDVGREEDYSKAQELYEKK